MIEKWIDSNFFLSLIFICVTVFGNFRKVMYCTGTDGRQNGSKRHHVRAWRVLQYDEVYCRDLHSCGRRVWHNHWTRDGPVGEKVFGCLGSHILRRVLWPQEEELSLLMIILNRRAGESCLLCLPHFPPHTALPTTSCNPILILLTLPG